MIKAILWDIDGTLLDFIASERYAVRKCFEMFQLGECTDEMLKRYSEINRKYWEMLELGKVSKPHLLEWRFRDFLREEGLSDDCAPEFQKKFEWNLPDCIVFHDEGYELVKKYSGKIKQYIITNGLIETQNRKMEKSGLNQWMDGVFISDEVGIDKPNVGYFDYVLDHIEPFKKEELLVVGDSLTSDIKGANNAGIPCCWYNPKGKKNDKGVTIDYEIRNLWEIESILEK